MNRDTVRPSIDVLIDALKLVFPLIGRVDVELHAFLLKSNVIHRSSNLNLIFTFFQVQPFFVLSWFLTWFSHNIYQFDVLTHLFDFFLSSHPLMPLYMCAQVVLSERTQILQLECEYSEVHGYFSKLPPLPEPALLCVDCAALFQSHPPLVLLHACGIEFPLE